MPSIAPKPSDDMSSMLTELTTEDRTETAEKTESNNKKIESEHVSYERTLSVTGAPKIFSTPLPGDIEVTALAANSSTSISNVYSQFSVTSSQ